MGGAERISPYGWLALYASAIGLAVVIGIIFGLMFG